MGNFDVDINDVKKLVELVQNHGLEELTVEEGDLSIKIKGKKTPAPQTHTFLHSNHSAEDNMNSSLPKTAEVEEEVFEVIETIEEDLYEVIAPLVGVFYRSPSPTEPPFIEVGDKVEVGTELGVIEAMKVFSPLPSEVAGEVVEIPAVNGKLVHEGDVLIRIRISQE